MGGVLVKLSSARVDHWVSRAFVYNSEGVPKRPPYWLAGGRNSHVHKLPASKDAMAHAKAWMGDNGKRASKAKLCLSAFPN